MIDKKLIIKIDEVAQQLREANITDGADEMFRISRVLSDSKNQDPKYTKLLRKELTMLLSLTGSIRGLQDLCPPDTEYNSWSDRLYSIYHDAKTVHDNLD